MDLIEKKEQSRSGGGGRGYPVRWRVERCLL